MRARRRSTARVLRLASLGGLLAVVAWDARGCRSTPEVAQIDCDPVEASAAALSAGGLAGEYDLTMVGADGARAGGKLRLSEYGPGQTPAAARVAPTHPGAAARYPLYGSAELPVESLGAETPGSITSHDPDAPGVQVVEWISGTGEDAANRITLRFGADANRGDDALFDGPHLSLHVHAISPDSFAGAWSSGGGDVAASGHFCARRVATTR
jgi:hypothetical protein